MYIIALILSVYGYFINGNNRDNIFTSLTPSLSNTKRVPVCRGFTVSDLTLGLTKI